MTVKPCSLELKDIHPEFVDSKVKGLIFDLLHADDNATLLHILNQRTSSGDTEQVQCLYYVSFIF